MLYDKYLFTLSVILGAEITHSGVPTRQMPGMHQHLYPLNSLPSFVVLLQSCFSTRYAPFFGTNDATKS